MRHRLRLHALAVGMSIGAVWLSSAGPSLSATRGMVGSLGVVNPDVAQPGLFDAGPGAFGKKFGPHPPTAGARTISVAGATAGTLPGRKITLPVDRMNFQGGQFRDFPAFPGIAQSTKTSMVLQPAATFMAGGGALALCPGPGCNASGMGTAISFCPPLVPSPLLPGTAMAQIGNWGCTRYTAAGLGRRGIRLSIQKRDGGSRFGGTLRLLRSGRSTIWRVLEPPPTSMGLAIVERAWRTGIEEEAAGGPNFVQQVVPEHNGPQILARLNARGAITATAGCANGVGTVGPGKTYRGLPNPQGPFVPITGPGNACGTDPSPAPPGQVIGFRLTTGTLSGSDFFPFLDATTGFGTPFNPVFRPQSFAQGMYFTRMGGDSATPAFASRNIVLVGGGIAFDPKSANAFFRVTDLRFRILAPEPKGSAGLLICAALLAAWAGSARRPSRTIPQKPASPQEPHS